MSATRLVCLCRKLAVLFTMMMVVSISIPARAAAAPSKRVLAVQQLYGYMVAPNNQNVFSTTTTLPVDLLFAPTGTQGRIAPLGEGHDLATVKKYFFGLAQGQPLSSSMNYLSYVSGVTFRSITDAAPFVFVEVDVSFAPTALGNLEGITAFQVRETGQFTFNKNNQITSFDLLIPYFDTAMLFDGENFSDPNFVNVAMQAVCSLALTNCTTSNSGYASVADCETFLSSIPTGNLNRVSGNSLVCRFFHSQFLASDPANECPNVGRSGGTQCVDTATYSTYFTETF